MSRNIWPQSSQIAEPLWTDPGIKIEIGVRKLIARRRRKRRREKRRRGMNGRTVSQMSSQVSEKPPPTSRRPTPRFQTKPLRYSTADAFFHSVSIGNYLINISATPPIPTPTPIPSCASKPNPPRCNTAGAENQIPSSLSSELCQVLFLEPAAGRNIACLLYTSPSPRDRTTSRMPSSA